MKKLLPKTSGNPQGFTLIELMVAIAIVAILSVIGVVLYSNAQKNARDARRRSEVEAIANALETHKTPGLQTYNPLADTQFADGKVPADGYSNCQTGLCAYCFRSSAGACTASDTVVAVGEPSATTTSWTVCSNLEGDSPTYYCKSSAQ